MGFFGTNKMKKEFIELWLKTKLLRARQIDKDKIVSMLKTAEINAKVVRKLPLEEENATVIFRELYESIRQLGDAKWWLLGYESLNHEISLDVLKELDIKEKIKLNNIDRFKRIRHDANYRGFIVSFSQAKEIIEFWDDCCKEIMKMLLKELG